MWINAALVASDITNFNTAVTAVLNISSIDELIDVDTTTVPPNPGDLLSWDGTNWVPIPSPATPPILQLYDVSGSAEGVPQAAEFILNFVACRDFTLPANLFGSRAVAQTASTAVTDWTFDISVNGVPFSTLTFSMGNTVGVFDTSTEQNIVAGDIITISTTTAQDSDLSDVTISLKGSTFDTLGLLDIAASAPGLPASDLFVMNYVFVRDYQFVSSLIGSEAAAQVAASDGPATFNIFNNGVQFASCEFMVAATTGTYSVSVPALLQFSAGDILTIVAPNVPDSTLSDVTFTLKGLTL